jgi:hypothetical protein
MVVTVAELKRNKAFEAKTKRKGFYQLFSLYFIAIWLFFTCTISVSILYFYFQNKQSQVVVTQQLQPLNIKFLHQSYLVKANSIIDRMLEKNKMDQLLSLQEKLFEQNQHITSLNPLVHNLEPQWPVNNKTVTNLLASIATQHTSNVGLTKNALIQLNSLRDVLTQRLNNKNIVSEDKSLLLRIQGNIIRIITLFERLNLQTSINNFEQLQWYIDETFVKGFVALLTIKKNKGMNEVISGFTHFEDTVLQRGLLTKWQGNLRMMSRYQQKVLATKKQLNESLERLSENVDSGYINTNTPLKKDIQTLAQRDFLIGLIVAFLFCMVIMSTLLWLLRSRIKAASEFTVEYINQAIVVHAPPQINEATPQSSKAFYSKELGQLLQTIEQLNNSLYSEDEYQMLKKENKELADKVAKNEKKYTQSVSGLESGHHEMPENRAQLFEQQRIQTLYLATINQLALLGCSAINHKVSTKEEDAYFFEAYMQGCEVANKIDQISYQHYLKADGSVLTLSDTNLLSLMQATVLNLESRIADANNEVSLVIDKKILPNVNLDIELFSELLNVFMKLLLSDNTEKRLRVSVQLIDKNSGQQTICFSGEVLSGNNIKQIPKALTTFNEAGCEQSELVQYFNTLLQYQHGNDASASLTEQGYQLNFTVPLAVTNNIQQLIPLSIVLPTSLSAIERVIMKWASKYKEMPIEVLLAAREPVQYQRLQQLLTAIGLQVTFTSSEVMLQKYWQTGRFSILITEIECSPYISFVSDEILDSQGKPILPRGVFTLDSTLSFTLDTQKRPGWAQGKLSADSSFDTLIEAMIPWIKDRTDITVIANEIIPVSNESTLSETVEGEQGAKLSKDKLSFNFERYIKHQGSIELALYMIDEYTGENVFLVDGLNKAFVTNDMAAAEAAMSALMINGRILAANDLLNTCQQWSKLIKQQGLDRNDKAQISLLNQINKKVKAISRHAESIA